MTLTKLQAQNIVQMLQREPFYYRHFGWLWWFVKSQLKNMGFTRKNLHHLGDNDDPSVLPHYRAEGPDAMMAEAWQLQYENATHNRNARWSMLPDGEPYFIHDDDAE